MITSRPIYFCTFAVPRMPRCWIANTSSISTAPMTNAELMENETGPSECENSVQVRAYGVKAAMASWDMSALDGILRGLAGVGGEPFGNAR